MNKETLKSIIVSQLEELQEGKTEMVSRAISIESYLNKEEALVITGIRRSGKSTLLNQAILKLLEETPVFYLNFEDTRLINFELEDFSKAYEAWLEMLESTPKKIYLFFDEIQLIKNWERWVNQLVKNSKHKVVITGSNSSMLSSELSSLLTGRHEVLNLMPLGFREVIDSHKITENPLGSKYKIRVRQIFNYYTKFGGFPRSYLDSNAKVLQQYFKDILIKDICIRKKIANPKIIQELGFEPLY